MNEGRQTQIVMLDERHLELLVQPKLNAGDLLNMVSSHYNLKEKEYFGLAFKDKSGHFHWLHSERKVLEHEFPEKSGPLKLFFSIKFFIGSILNLRENITIELFYLQSRLHVSNGIFDCDSDTVFELAAYVLQATHGDFIDDDTTCENIKKLKVLPTSCLLQHPSISVCEKYVINHYKKIAGNTRGSCIVSYMSKAQEIPTYGVHFYEVKDKQGMPMWLGLNFKGVLQFDYKDKRTPRRIFPWKQLENLYYREKKFSIEVHDPKRQNCQTKIKIRGLKYAVSVSRRTFAPGNVNVFCWFTSSSSLAKVIWHMAIAQHKFYLEHKDVKGHLPLRTENKTAEDLCMSSTSLQSSGSGGISRSSSAHSLSLGISNSQDTLDDQILRKHSLSDLFAAQKSRLQALQEALIRKTKELKELCMKEAEITGHVPPEYPLSAGESIPVVSRIFSKASATANQQADDHLSNLEVSFDVQYKFTEKAYQHCKEFSNDKNVMKQRHHTYHKAYQKLLELEAKCNEARAKVGREPLRRVKRFNYDRNEGSSPCHSPSIQRKLSQDFGQIKIKSSPKVEVVEMDANMANCKHLGSSLSTSVLPSFSQQISSSPILHSHQSEYQHHAHYKYSRGSAPYSSPHYSNFETHRNIAQASPFIHNLYNVNTFQTARYDSGDELKTSDDEDEQYYYNEGRVIYPNYDDYGNNSLPRSSQSCGKLTRSSSLSSRKDSVNYYNDSTCIDSPCDVTNPVGNFQNDSLSDSRLQIEAHLLQQNFHHSTPNHLADNFSEQCHTHSNITHKEPYLSQNYVRSLPRNFSQDKKHSNFSSINRYELDSAKDGKKGIYIKPPLCELSQAGSPLDTTVTKYESFVEVSKPFEMSDFYKYSEKFRKNQGVQYRTQKFEQILSGSDLAFNNSISSIDNTYMVEFNADHVNQPPSCVSDMSNFQNNLLNSSPSKYNMNQVSSPCSPLNWISHSHLPNSFYSDTPPSPIMPKIASHNQSNLKDKLPYLYDQQIHDKSSKTFHIPFHSSENQFSQSFDSDVIKENPNMNSSKSNLVNETELANHSYIPKELASFDGSANIASTFSTEMLAWYEDHDEAKSSTFV